MGLVAERWTDERMDELKGQVEGLDRRMEQGFRDLRVEIGGLRSDMEERFGGVRGEIGDLRSDMDERFERLEARFDALLYALIGFGGAMFAAMATLVAAVLLS